jgi:hypothetical protein
MLGEIPHVSRILPVAHLQAALAFIARSISFASQFSFFAVPQVLTTFVFKALLYDISLLIISAFKYHIHTIFELVLFLELLDVLRTLEFSLLRV